MIKALLVKWLNIFNTNYTHAYSERATQEQENVINLFYPHMIEWYVVDQLICDIISLNGSNSGTSNVKINILYFVKTGIKLVILDLRKIAEVSLRSHLNSVFKVQ